MSIVKKIRFSRSVDRLIEEEAYAVAVREIESGQRRDGIWGKAISETGSEAEAKRRYIKLRVQALVDEAVVRKTFNETIHSEAHPSDVNTRAPAPIALGRTADSTKTTEIKATLGQILIVFAASGTCVFLGVALWSGGIDGPGSIFRPYSGYLFGGFFIATGIVTGALAALLGFVALLDWIAGKGK
jgi:hypothetical protein